MSIDWGALADARDVAHRQWADPEKPFPYCVFEHVLEHGAAVQAANDFDTAPFAVGEPHRVEKHSFRKRGGPWNMLSPLQTRIIEELNSERFVRYLESVTGLKPLQSDPTLFGGGVHEIMPGGYLNIHADFNMHPKFNTLRALNLIIYLNDEWQDEWEGHLELWDDKVRHRIARFAPAMNRGVLFRTNEISYHGHPTPLACPNGKTRRSIALYYYLPWDKSLAARLNTNYQLVPWQWAQLAGEIAELVENRQDTLEAVTSALIDRWQSDDIRTAYDWLTTARTWTLRPDGAHIEPKVELFTVDLNEHHDWRPARLTPNTQLEIKGGRYISRGDDPFFTINFDRPTFAFLLKMKLPPEAEADTPSMFFDFGSGMNASHQRVFPATSEGWHAFRFVSNKRVHALRIDPFSRPCETSDFEVQIGKT
jgi:2OG-Fe(II) oxygenase superfamily